MPVTKTDVDDRLHILECGKLGLQILTEHDRPICDMLYFENNVNKLDIPETNGDPFYNSLNKKIVSLKQNLKNSDYENAKILVEELYKEFASLQDSVL